MRKTANDDFIMGGFAPLPAKVSKGIDLVANLNQRLVAAQITQDPKALKAIAQEFHGAGMVKKAAEIMRSI